MAGCARTGSLATDLRARLDLLYDGFNHAQAVADPIELVRRYADPADREIVGFCAAALAFGRVASVLDAVERLLAIIGPSPAAFVRRLQPSAAPAFATLGHRWTRGIDHLALLWILRHMLAEAGSIEAFFLRGHDPAADDLAPSIESFATRASEIDLEPIYGSHSTARGARYFFPRPSAGSACKRLNLFLRWMIRRDAVDLGVWDSVAPAQLVVPLDTHVIRVGQCLRLTRYRTPGWRMAAEITAALREIDPADPVRYDFALCHLGMMNACGFMRPQADAQCPLRGACRPRGRRPRASGAPSARR